MGHCELRLTTPA